MHGLHHAAPGDQRSMADSSTAASDTCPEFTGAHPAAVVGDDAFAHRSHACPPSSHPAPDPFAAAHHAHIAAQQPPGATHGASASPMFYPEEAGSGGAVPWRRPLQLPRVPLDDAAAFNDRRRERRDDAVRAVSSLPSSPLRRDADAPSGEFAAAHPPHYAHHRGPWGGGGHRGDGSGMAGEASGGRMLGSDELRHPGIDIFEGLSESPAPSPSGLRHTEFSRGDHPGSLPPDPRGMGQHWGPGWTAPAAGIAAAPWQVGGGAGPPGLYGAADYAVRPVRRFSDTYSPAPAPRGEALRACGFGPSALRQSGSIPGLGGLAERVQHRHQAQPLQRELLGQSDVEMDTEQDQPWAYDVAERPQQMSQNQARDALARHPSPQEHARHPEQAAVPTRHQHAPAAERFERQVQPERPGGAAGPGLGPGSAQDTPTLTWASKQAKGPPGRANYSLFYLVPDDDGARAQLCAVGVDTRQSGHYIYSGVPTTWFPQMPPLSVTNTSKVRQWLDKALGLSSSDCASYTAHENLPRYTEDEIRLKLGLKPTGLGGVLEESKRKSAHYGSPERGGREAHTSGDSVPAPKGPESLRQGWNFLEEHKEHLPDGRKRIVFTLVDSPQRTRVFSVVTADESRPNDRRYLYKANKEIGGYFFKNKAAATEWIKKHFLAPPVPLESFARRTTSASETVPLRLASVSDAAARDSIQTGGSVDAQEPQVNPADLPAVEAAFQGESDLLQWAVATPAPPLLLQFELWALQLKAGHCISALQPPAMQPFSAAAARSQPDVPLWTSVEEAVHILQALSQAEVSLQLLERSGISSCIAHLRSHPDPRLADLARLLSDAWGAKAQRSLQYATAALAAAPLSEARP